MFLHVPDFTVTCHLTDWVVYVHGIFNHCTILKHFYLFSYTSYGEEITVTIKLYTEIKEIKKKFGYLRLFWRLLIN